jgi:hypothetical protein
MFRSALCPNAVCASKDWLLSHCRTVTDVEPVISGLIDEGVLEGILLKHEAKRLISTR